MEQKGVIQGYTTLLDPDKYGYQFNRVHVQLTGVDENKLHEITEYMKKFPYMFRLVELFELYGFMIELVCHSYDDMEQVLSEFRDRYREHIISIETIRVTKIYKRVYFPTFSKTPKKGK